MPTADRKLRPRRTLADTIKTDTEASLLEEARVADGAKAVWDAGLRARFVRHLAQRMRLEDAQGIARAYERKPQYIPSRPPKGAA